MNALAARLVACGVGDALGASRGAGSLAGRFRFATPARASILRLVIEAAVVGANGYSGEELCGILARHPRARLAAVTSRQHEGKAVGEVLPRLAGHPGLGGLAFAAPDAGELLRAGIRWVFLALPHGLAADFAAPLLAGGCRVIDLSADFRIHDAAVFEEFYGAPHAAPGLLGEAVYGLPERHRESIRTARLVASPGCYPTSILLPLLPLLAAGLLDPDSIVASSVSGVSGAGRKTETPYLFGECNESVRAYGLPKHRHLAEIEQELAGAAGRPLRMSFIPHLAPMTRGIHTTIVARPLGDLPSLEACWQEAFAGEPFVRLGGRLPDTKHVAGTNFCDIALRHDARTGRVVLLSALDNLVKGAAGQAVQCFNLMSGGNETDGLP